MCKSPWDGSQIKLFQFCSLRWTKWMELAPISAIINQNLRAAAEEVSNVRTQRTASGSENTMEEFAAWGLGLLLGAAYPRPLRSWFRAIPFIALTAACGTAV